jgi:type II secretory ATPase GspE/PulE/Tfp pilus assembly ATPase PilB-like protein
MDSPIEKLTNAILLSAIKQRASEIWIHRDADRSLVEFRVDGIARPEMEPPVAIHANLVRRLAIMASLPVYAKGEVASGTIHLLLGGDREAWFGLHVRGHGTELEARLALLTAEQAAERHQV